MKHYHFANDLVVYMWSVAYIKKCELYRLSAQLAEYTKDWEFFELVKNGAVTNTV